MKVVITEKRLRVFGAIIILALFVVVVCTYLEVISISRQSEKLECFEGYVAASLTDENVKYEQITLKSNSKSTSDNAEFFLVIENALEKDREIKISGEAVEVVEKVYDQNFGVSDVASELYGKKVVIKDNKLEIV